jgi:hypothetical protein
MTPLSQLSKITGISEETLLADLNTPCITPIDVMRAMGEVDNKSSIGVIRESQMSESFRQAVAILDREMERCKSWHTSHPSQEQQEGKGVRSKEEIVNESFKGLAEFIQDKEIFEWYKGLICTCMELYHDQFKSEDNKPIPVDWEELKAKFISEMTGNYKGVQYMEVGDPDKVFNWFKEQIGGGK